MENGDTLLRPLGGKAKKKSCESIGLFDFAYHQFSFEFFTRNVNRYTKSILFAR